MTSKLIAHAGGKIDEVCYTNSREAILSSSQIVDLIELDLVPTQDGIVIAHSNFESKYGLKEKFHKITTAQFLSSRFDDKFIPPLFCGPVRALNNAQLQVCARHKAP